MNLMRGLYLMFRSPERFDKLAREDAEHLSKTDPVHQFARAARDVRRGVVASFGLVALTISAGWVVGLVLGRYVEPAPPLVNQILQYVGVGVILWATLAIRGWSIQSFNGNTLPERLNRAIYRVLYVLGSLLLVLSVAWPLSSEPAQTGAVAVPGGAQALLSSAEIKEFVGIFVSTFVGAWAAFLLQGRREAAKDRAVRVAALRGAQFALVAQVNVLDRLRRDLEPLRADPNRDLSLGPIAYFQEIPGIDLPSLAFLLESTPDLLNALVVCQNKWNTVVGILRQHSHEYRRFQGRSDEAVRAGVMPSQPQQVRDLVGPDIIGALRTLTDALYETMDGALQANEALFNELSQQLTRQFPDQRPLKRELNPEVIARAPAGV